MNETEVPDAPKPPNGLKAAGKRFFREIFETYRLDGSPEMVMLVEEAARTADVVQRLQTIVDKADTLRTSGSRGQDVAIPELDALRAYRAQFAALVKQLDLPEPMDDEDDDGNPASDGPMTRSQAGKHAAGVRWHGRNNR